MSDEPIRWIFRIDNQDDEMMSWGTRLFEDSSDSGEVARYVAAENRVSHSYHTGLLVVSVWKERPFEHYHKEVPEDATVYIYNLTGLVNILQGTEEYKQWKHSASSP